MKMSSVFDINAVYTVTRRCTVRLIYSMVRIKCQSRGLLTFIARDNSIITSAVKKNIYYNVVFFVSDSHQLLQPSPDGKMAP